VRDDLDFPSTPAPWPFPPVASPLFRKPKPSPWREYVRPGVLFAVTALSIFVHGLMLSQGDGPMETKAIQDGLLLVVAVVGIMLAHEMGHYLACRYYGVDATLPHFLPAPPIFIGFSSPPILISLIGTFGAFIRIRAPFPHRRALFDIGIAGPLAGFVVTLFVLAAALHDFRFAPASDVGPSPFGNPLLFQVAESWLGEGGVPAAPEGMRTVIGLPLFLAAWFGTFLTALNLMPVGQLDGGHVVYALLGRRGIIVSRVAFWMCVCLVYFGPSWIVWSLLLFFLGRGHPTTLDEADPIGRARVAVGLLGLVVFVLCFMPTPLVWMGWHEAFKAMRGELQPLLHLFT
jgi:membrane-associated protease RseP (regulator of RpoE activity)